MSRNSKMLTDIQDAYGHLLSDYHNVCTPDYNSLGRRVTGEVFPQEISPVKVISISEIGSLAEGRDMS